MTTRGRLLSFSILGSLVFSATLVQATPVRTWGKIQSTKGLPNLASRSWRLSDYHTRYVFSLPAKGSPKKQMASIQDGLNARLLKQLPYLKRLDSGAITYKARRHRTKEKSDRIKESTEAGRRTTVLRGSIETGSASSSSYAFGSHNPGFSYVSTRGGHRFLIVDVTNPISSGASGPGETASARSLNALLQTVVKKIGGRSLGELSRE